LQNAIIKSTITIITPRRHNARYRGLNTPFAATRRFFLEGKLNLDAFDVTSTKTLTGQMFRGCFGAQAHLDHAFAPFPTRYEIPTDTIDILDRIRRPEQYDCFFWGRRRPFRKRRQDPRKATMIIPVKRTKQKVPKWVSAVDQNPFYKCICELFEMGAKFKRTVTGFEVVYPDHRETDGKRCESVLRSDVYKSLRLLIRFGLVTGSCEPEEKQPPSRSVLSPV
jgi:hypothetical protein